MKTNAPSAQLRTAAPSAIAASAEFPNAIHRAFSEKFSIDTGCLPNNDRITTGYRPDSDRIISRENRHLTRVISETCDFFYRNPHPKNLILTPGASASDPLTLPNSALASRDYFAFAHDVCYRTVPPVDTPLDCCMTDGFFATLERVIAGLLHLRFFQRALLLIFLSLLLQGTSRAQTTNGTNATNGSVQVVGRFAHPALVESSGLVASKRYPGVLWTHNDDGEPFLFAITRSGQSLGAFEVQGAALIDWEALSNDEFGNLYLADIGTNGIARTHFAIHRVEEPNPADAWGAARIQQTWLFRYPGEPEDAESFFVLDGYGYVMTKYPRDGAVSLYRFLLGSSSVSTLQLVARLATTHTVSDMALSPDRQRIALATSDGVEVFFINGNPANISPNLRRDTEYKDNSLEGITFVPDGILATSDGSPDILLFNSEQLTGAPIISKGLTNKTVFVGADVVFSVEATGIPAVTYAWFFNRQLLPGQTNATLVLTNVTLANAGLYQVVVSNAAGSARSSATLTVLERNFEVRITEVMSSEVSVNGVLKRDWWELTSFDTDAIDLSGWRFNDASGGLTNAAVIPSGTIIRPGESIIFVEDLTPAQFRAWWGATNIPAGTQIITYSGLLVGFNDRGDTLRLWTSGVTDVSAVYEQATFGPAEIGVSFGFNPDTMTFGERSRVGVHGAFVAAVGPDVGSPGLIRSGPPVETVDLRITEIMSSEVFSPTVPKADWWELTSFETVPVDISGWRFNDNAGDVTNDFVIPNGVVIRPGESIIFVENLTPDQFRAWWGETNIPAGTQIITYVGPGLGFDDQGDALRLWTSNGTFFAEETFGIAELGVSFSYNPATGELEPSRVGVNGAFQAAAGPEIGSPGRISGAPPVDTIDLRITEVMSTEAAPNVDTEDWWELTSFDTQAIDLSGWRFNDNTGGLTDPFVIPAGITIQPGESIIFVENLTRDEFLAWWGTNNITPTTQIITYTNVQISFSGTEGDSLFLWDATATDTNDTIDAVSFGPAPAPQSFSYNPLTGELEPSREGVNGAFVAAAGLDVGSPGRITGPTADILDVEITEVMSFPATNNAVSADWWELTSFDTEPIDLSGWRFNDNASEFTNDFVIPNGITIQPGESIVFVEDLTREEFLTWWGAQVPAGTQIITYTGDELSFSAAGDSLRLWTGANTNTVFKQVTFGAADQGVTFGFDPVTRRFGEKSVEGQNGAFRSATGLDVGSPGKIRNAEQVQVQFTATGVQIEIRASTETRFAIEACDDLVNAAWVQTDEVLTTQGTPLLLEKPRDGSMRFYRVRKLY
jgi:hypothetical protein